MRRRARERAMQFLFGLEFTAYDWRESLESFWVNSPSKAGVKAYADALIEGVMERREELDAMIAEAAENWAADRIGRIERNVIRVALFEIRHGQDVPPNVAINEALEVAKLYGADDSPRFVNGILDRLKQMMESET
jgi:transcription antitermination protein NusB